jgi:hypothetical protein
MVNAQTEVITLPGSATDTAGTKYFLTVTAAEMSAQPSGNVSLGSNNSRGMGMLVDELHLKDLLVAAVEQQEM